MKAEVTGGAADRMAGFVERTADGLSDEATLRAVGELGARGGDLILDGLSNVDWQEASDLAASGRQASIAGLAPLLNAAANAFASIDFDL